MLIYSSSARQTNGTKSTFGLQLVSQVSLLSAFCTKNERLSLFLTPFSLSRSLWLDGGPSGSGVNSGELLSLFHSLAARNKANKFAFSLIFFASRAGACRSAVVVAAQSLTNVGLRRASDCQGRRVTRGRERERAKLAQVSCGRNKNQRRRRQLLLIILQPTTFQLSFKRISAGGGHQLLPLQVQSEKMHKERAGFSLMLASGERTAARN